ncbi:MAG: hypothetical protein V4657_09490 [Pseudomonadota bacterium]
MGIDATASAALDATVIKPIFLAFVDFLNEPMRVNTSGADLTLTGTGEVDIDGILFQGLRADVVDIGPVANRVGGTDSIQIKLSGLPVFDADILDEINDPANWRSREIRLWRIIRNALNVQQGGVQHYYTGYMSNLTMPVTPTGQTIEVTVESYLAALSAASNRTYMDQEKYDAGDLSARAAIAIGNNASGGSPAGSTFAPGGGGGGSRDGRNPNVREV